MNTIRNRQHGPLLLALSTIFVFSCALTSKSVSIIPRYFSPERVSGTEERVSPTPGLTAELRLGHITAASYLDERMVFRDSNVELGYYQEKRWTEVPEEYLRRQLERALFEESGLRHVVGGSAPTLEVELTAFEEIRKPKRIARVQVSVRLQDSRLVRWEQTLTVDQPVGPARDDNLADEMVEAIGVALTTVVHQIAERVTKELAAPAVAVPHEKK